MVTKQTSAPLSPPGILWDPGGRSHWLSKATLSQEVHALLISVVNDWECVALVKWETQDFSLGKIKILKTECYRTGQRMIVRQFAEKKIVLFNLIFRNVVELKLKSMWSTQACPSNSGELEPWPTLRLEAQGERLKRQNYNLPNAVGQKNHVV